MTGWSAAQLETLLQEANTDPWESVQAALSGLDGVIPARIMWLKTHLAVTKREYAALIAGAAGTPLPPDDADLSALMAWELPVVRELTDAQLASRVTHAGREFTVAELIRLNARHTAWHAGQIAALSSRLRSA